MGQLVAFVLLVAPIGGLAFAFVTKGVKIKPDPENKPNVRIPATGVPGAFN